MAKSQKKRGIAPDERGFSMIELLVALAMLAIIFGTALPAMYAALNLGRNNRNRSISANLAAQQIDIARSAASTVTGFQSLANGKTSSTQVVGGVTYTINQYSEWEAPGATTGSCNGSKSANAQLLRINVEVTWPNMQGIPTVKNQTILAPPVGTYSPYTGAIGVLITDHAGVPLPNINVTVSGGTANPPPQVSSVDGCAYFAFVPIFANYVVTLTKAGYVMDGQVGATASQAAGVSAGVAVQLAFSYDLATSLAPTFAGSASIPGAVPALPLTVANTSLQPTGTKVMLASDIPQWGNLYPYMSGYRVWAGDCSDADPSAYPPTPRPGAVNVTAGGPAAPVAPPLQSVDVTVKTTIGGLPVPNETITVNHAINAISCTAGDTFPMTGLKTDAFGVLRVALPFGTWTFTAAGLAGLHTGTGGSVSLVPPTTTTVPIALVNVP